MNPIDLSSIRRRDFLSLGSAGLASLVASAASPAFGAKSEAPKVPGRSGPVSVGYWTGSDRYPELDWATAMGSLDIEEDRYPRVVPADRLRSGGRLLEASGVKLTLHGLFPTPDPATLAARASVLFDIVYELERPIVHRAWNLRGGPNPNVSSRVSVYVPIEEPTYSLLFRGELQGYGTGVRKGLASRVAQKAVTGKRPPVMAPPTRLWRRLFQTRLSARGESGVPKLVRGFYLIGLPSHIDGQPPTWIGDPRDMVSDAYSCLLISVDHGDFRR